MSDRSSNPDSYSAQLLHSPLAIYSYAEGEQLAQALQASLNDPRYSLTQFHSPQDLLELVAQDRSQIDCLLLESSPSLLEILENLYTQGILLPLVLVDSPKQGAEPTPVSEIFAYHTAEVRQSVTQLKDLPGAIERAIAQFLKLTPTDRVTEASPEQDCPSNSSNFLRLQQRRLSEKLKERLGYLGIYYKRNPQEFWRNLSAADQQQLLKTLSLEYREIVLSYFTQDAQINPIIDQFVNRAFFADLSVSQILEIHMELIDDFSQQLKLEGRSEEILLDYRLALIDIIAHLCEMYRRSIPREDLLLELYSRD